MIEEEQEKNVGIKKIIFKDKWIDLWEIILKIAHTNILIRVNISLIGALLARRSWLNANLFKVLHFHNKFLLLFFAFIFFRFHCFISRRFDHFITLLLLLLLFSNTIIDSFSEIIEDLLYSSLSDIIRSDI